MKSVVFSVTENKINHQGHYQELCQKSNAHFQGIIKIQDHPNQWPNQLSKLLLKLLTTNPSFNNSQQILVHTTLNPSYEQHLNIPTKEWRNQTKSLKRHLNKIRVPQELLIKKDLLVTTLRRKLEDEKKGPNSSILPQLLDLLDYHMSVCQLLGEQKYTKQVWGVIGVAIAKHLWIAISSPIITSWKW